jgi:hypothetical protein
MQNAEQKRKREEGKRSLKDKRKKKGEGRRRSYKMMSYVTGFLVPTQSKRVLVKNSADLLCHYALTI